MSFCQVVGKGAGRLICYFYVPDVILYIFSFCFSMIGDVLSYTVGAYLVDK